MKTRALILAALIAASANAASAAPIQTLPFGAPEEQGCSVTVNFGSYAMGIDGPVLARVTRIVETDRRVKSATMRPWGREGERTLCIRTVGRANANHIYDRIRAVIPRRSDQAPTGIRSITGRQFQNQSGR